MRFLGKHTRGTPADDYVDVHPSILSEHYGIDRPEHVLHHNQSGAGHSDDETSEAGEESTLHEDNDWMPEPSEHSSPVESSMDEASIDAQIAASQQRHIRHAPIPVPAAACPFRSPETLDIFWKCLRDVATTGIVPEHYRLRESEWPDGEYGKYAHIKLGQQGSTAVVDLPFAVWLPRAVLWAQGLEIMSRLLLAKEDAMADA
ncbi:hypothetical protein C2E23DRAFT_729043 [Lenzites betulinus]|nr:hypothetical protein C2E23DRAFT_729043 [Lenzites betulinus]